MKVFEAGQIGTIDQFTIENEPISSHALMERASQKVVEWILSYQPDSDTPIVVFCGPGNNGGDGLAVARLLSRREYEVSVLLFAPTKQSADNQDNWSRLTHENYVETYHIRDFGTLPAVEKNAIFVDALFGYGLSRAPSGIFAEAIEYINHHPGTVISIDLPSGLLSDKTTPWTTVKASYTLTFQFPKLSFLIPENQSIVGDWQILDISLHPTALANTPTPYNYVQEDLVKSLLKPRRKFDHKGSFGHACLICGQYGKMGAAILAANACLRSGVGLLTTHIPKCGVALVQVARPEAMVSPDQGEFEIKAPPTGPPFDAMGIGCGIGTSKAVGDGFASWLSSQTNPMVLDADALNLLAASKDLLHSIPSESILTPHPGEYKRLFGTFSNNFSRLAQQRQLSVEYQIYIVLKGANTCITTPDGTVYFNSTGNPGMATAGSGDVLTGLLTGLIAQGYNPLDTCILGVHLHGLAGDLASKRIGEQAMLASDIVEHIGQAWNHIKAYA